MKTIGEKQAKRRLGPVGVTSAPIKAAALRLVAQGRRYRHKSGRAPARLVEDVLEKPRRIKIRLDDGRLVVAKMPELAVVFEGGHEVWADQLKRSYERLS